MKKIIYPIEDINDINDINDLFIKYKEISINNYTYSIINSKGEIIIEGLDFAYNIPYNNNLIYITKNHNRGYFNIDNYKIYDEDFNIIPRMWDGVKVYSIDKKINKILSL